MRNKLIYILLAALLLSPWPTYIYGDDALGQDTIDAEVAERSTLSTRSTNSSSAESTIASGQTIAVKNPTFQEVRDFILRDTTSRNEFVLNQYECRHFAAEVNNNAEAAGLRCALVLLCFQRGQHAIIAFDTTDRGMLYIEPQTDSAIQPEVGGKYEGREIEEILIAW